MRSGLRIAVWNAEFKSPHSSRGAAIRDILAACDADIICLTEAYADSLPAGGHVLCSTTDYGYRVSDGRRKVLLWSRQPWADTDCIGDQELPPGRIANGVTRTAIGEICAVGVCIPWKDAHVRTGLKNCTPWEEHLRYLSVLRRLIPVLGQQNLIILGDWNQRVPRSRVPDNVADALALTMEGLCIATAGPLQPLGRLVIDHVAHTPDLVCTNVTCWSEQSASGLTLTDHSGVCVVLDRACDGR
jgi:hypothetical protein